MTKNLKDLIDHWQSWLQHTRRFSKHTIIAYRTDLDGFLIFIQNHLGQEVTIDLLVSLSIRDFRSWLSNRAQQDYTSRSTARALSVLRNFYRFLTKETGLSSPSLNLIRSPRLKIGLPKPLTQQQAVNLIDEVETIASENWIAQRDRAICALLYGAGLRIGEALSLNRTCLPLEETLTIDGKGGKQRIIPLLPIIRQEVDLYIHLCPFSLSKEAPLFIGAKGQRLNPGMIQKTLRQYRRLAGLPESATPHALRHSFATHLMDSCHDVRAIQELLGHASLATTQIYTKVETHKLLEIYGSAHPRQRNTR